MLRVEKRFRRFLLDHFFVIAIFVVAVIGVLIRSSLFSMISGDLEYFYRGWMYAIQKGQITVLIENGNYDYSPLVFYIYKIVGDLFKHKAKAEVLCKAIACGADVAMCLLSFAFVWSNLRSGDQRDWKRLIVFGAWWLHPILILNGSGWGQLDCFFAFFSVCSVWLLVKERPILALLSFGVACAWKLQAVLLLPLFVFMYLCGNKRFSLVWFALIPAVMVAFGLPMMHIGVSPLWIFEAFFSQASSFSTQLVKNYPNIYVLLGKTAEAEAMYLAMMIGFLATAFCLAAAWMVKNKTVLANTNTILLGAWSVLMCVYFLPRMHERYAIVGEILLLVYAMLVPGRRIWTAVLLCLTAVLNAYARYLAVEIMPEQLAAIFQMAAIVLVTLEWIGQLSRHGVSNQKHELIDAGLAGNSDC